MDYEFREVRQFGKFLTQVFKNFIHWNFYGLSYQLPGIDCAWVHPPTREKYSLLVKFDKVNSSILSQLSWWSSPPWPVLRTECLQSVFSTPWASTRGTSWTTSTKVLELLGTQVLKDFPLLCSLIFVRGQSTTVPNSTSRRPQSGFFLQRQVSATWWDGTEPSCTSRRVCTARYFPFREELNKKLW